MSLPSARLAPHATPLDRLVRLEAALGSGCPPLYIKRDDLLPFGGGGNKVRKADVLVSDALASGADTLITCGALQSNHARVTAAAGAACGLRVILILNGDKPDHPTGNLRLDYLFGADVRLVSTREVREAAMEDAATDIRRAGGRPYVIPLGGSSPLGAMGFARGVSEIGTAGIRPTVVVHASSSGATQAGMIAAHALLGSKARTLGISADESADALEARVSTLLDGMADRLGVRPGSIRGPHPIEIDDRHVGAGYGAPTDEAAEATTLVARHEGILLDPVYTAKAMAGLIAIVRDGAFQSDDIVVFWHTGGLHEQ